MANRGELRLPLRPARVVRRRLAWPSCPSRSHLLHAAYRGLARRQYRTCETGVQCAQRRGFRDARRGCSG